MRRTKLEFDVDDVRGQKSFVCVAFDIDIVLFEKCSDTVVVLGGVVTLHDLGDV